MERMYWISCMMALICLSGVSSRPSETESTADEVTEPPETENLEEGRAYPYYRVTQPPEDLPESTREILDKIRRINDQLTKPKREQINFNREESDEPNYVLDDDALKKLQQLITTGKLQPLSQQEYSGNFENNILRNSFSRALQFGQQSGYYNQQNLGINPGGNQSPAASLPASQQNAFQVGSILSQNGMNYSPMAYTVVNLPVLVPVPANELYQGYNPNMNRIDSPYSTRQRPQLPFPIQWPLAPYFPIFIRDPLLTYLGGGGLSDLIEYGQSADVCSRKQKSTDTNETNNMEDNEIETNASKLSSREGRAIKKRTVSHSTPVQQVETPKKTKQQKHSLNLFGNKNKVTKKKPAQPVYEEEEEEEAIDTKSRPSDGDLRFPFSDFGWFGNRKPVAPSPGFFINRLKVRRGGVAIAGPGGVATAGRGGTAIVGPGGLAYTQPGGLAVAGPAAKIYALPSTTDLSSLVTKLQNQQSPSEDGSVPRLYIPEGKLVATGPIIYYHELEQT